MKYTAERLKFQFHNGTIKTWIQKIEKGDMYVSFNSITVQLRQPHRDKRWLVQVSFNSITVQLRPIKYSKKTSNNKQVIQ